MLPKNVSVAGSQFCFRFFFFSIAANLACRGNLWRIIEWSFSALASSVRGSWPKGRNRDRLVQGV